MRSIRQRILHEGTHEHFRGWPDAIMFGITTLLIGSFIVCLIIMIIMGCLGDTSLLPLLSGFPVVFLLVIILDIWDNRKPCRRNLT